MPGRRHSIGAAVAAALPTGQALAAAIQTLLDDPQRAAALGQAGYRRVLQRFTWRLAAARTAAIYREVIRDYSRF